MATTEALVTLGPTRACCQGAKPLAIRLAGFIRPPYMILLFAVARKEVVCSGRGVGRAARPEGINLRHQHP